MVRDSGVKFELALQLKDLGVASEIAFSERSSAKIKMVGDWALRHGELATALKAYEAV